VTFNDPERPNGSYFAFSPNSVAFRADYVKVVEDRPINVCQCKFSGNDTILVIGKTRVGIKTNQLSTGAVEIDKLRL